MKAGIEYKLFSENREMLDFLNFTERKIRKLEISDEKIAGGKFRSYIIETIGLKPNERKILHDEKMTAFIVEVSHKGSAYSKLLDILLAYKKGEIKRCIFVTQTHALAVRRNRIKNPDSNVDGNRIYYEDACKTIQSYTETFLDLPMGILGIDINK